MDIQEQLEFKEDLGAFINSNGWRYVARPAIEQRCYEIERRLARGKRLDLEEIRELQAKHALLTELMENPVAFFLGE